MGDITLALRVAQSGLLGNQEALCHEEGQEREGKVLRAGRAFPRAVVG